MKEQKSMSQQFIEEKLVSEREKEHSEIHLYHFWREQGGFVRTCTVIVTSNEKRELVVRPLKRHPVFYVKILVDAYAPPDFPAIGTTASGLEKIK
ncbi:hypothetical protein B9Z55_028743 [Caenorhabditis nigoni]|uniref:Uncharacterized protein n=1 Tax=Caenorhabditis nigoni TaxID=1611254 RepID=A0A2G5SAJ7_9PELO|nr:hypothetical protein B9Z55_028743 [Caenorhabditis nigoni]